MDVQDVLSSLEKRVEAIELRNKRVEQNKNWETSKTRKISIALLTYLIMVTFLSVTGIHNPWPNAVVPTMGFLLSTLSLSIIRNRWKSDHK